MPTYAKLLINYRSRLYLYESRSKINYIDFVSERTFLIQMLRHMFRKRTWLIVFALPLTMGVPGRGCALECKCFTGSPGRTPGSSPRSFAAAYAVLQSTTFQIWNMSLYLLGHVRGKLLNARNAFRNTLRLKACPYLGPEGTNSCSKFEEKKGYCLAKWYPIRLRFRKPCFCWPQWFNRSPPWAHMSYETRSDSVGTR